MRITTTIYTHIVVGNKFVLIVNDITLAFCDVLAREYKLHGMLFISINSYVSGNADVLTASHIYGFAFDFSIKKLSLALVVL